MIRHYIIYRVSDLKVLGFAQGNLIPTPEAGQAIFEAPDDPWKYELAIDPRTGALNTIPTTKPRAINKPTFARLDAFIDNAVDTDPEALKRILKALIRVTGMQSLVGGE